jgi:hypothetical protein
LRTAERPVTTAQRQPERAPTVMIPIEIAYAPIMKLEGNPRIGEPAH